MLKQCFLLSLIIVSSLSAEYLSIPHSLRCNAIFYERSKQLSAFSCGYNVLFNAANFEHYCGFENDAHRYDTFKNKVMPYVRKRRCNPKGSSTNAMTEYLATNALNLQPFYHLHFDRRRAGGIGLSLTKNTHMTYPQISSKGRWHEDAIFSGINRYLATHTCAVVHFLCYVKARSENHGILVTIYQNEYGRGLYIFDNLNDPIYESTDITKFLKYLCKTFKISSKEEFEDIHLPMWWPYLDRTPRARR